LAARSGRSPGDGDEVAFLGHLALGHRQPGDQAWLPGQHKTSERALHALVDEGLRPPRAQPARLGSFKG
ncbi:MAG: hypothetical protein ACRDMI_05245, partial [Streptosporangiaceae bacterium]